MSPVFSDGYKHESLPNKTIFDYADFLKIRVPTACRRNGSCHECIVEIKGSHKIGKYMPGTRIPVLDEVNLYDEQPEYALLFSWHIADELIPKLKELGYKGKFIVPLPEPYVVD